MQINIPVLLREILQSGENLSIPGIGTFMTQYHSSTINYKDEFINPPYYSYTLVKEEMQNSLNLNEILTAKFDLNADQSVQIVNRFKTDINVQLKENKSLYLNGIGLLKNEEGGLILDSSNMNVKDLSLRLKNVPLLRYTEPKSDVPAEEKVKEIKIAEHQKESWAPMLWAIASCAILIFAFWFIDTRWNSSSQTDLSAEENQHIKKSRFNARPSFDSMFTIEENKQSDPKADSLTGESERIDSSMTADNNSGITSGKDELLADGTGKTTSPELAQKKGQSVAPDLDQNKVNGDVAQQNTNSSKSPEETGKAVEDQHCVVIVGAFGNQNNVNRMKEKLESRFDNIHFSKAGSLTRVGVYSSCSKTALKEVLHICRTEFESGSWIYIDQ